MPKEDIYSSSADGRLFCGGPATAGDSWSTVRSTGTAQNASGTATLAQVFAIMFSGKGADFFDIARAFFYFDMSSFPTYSTIDSASIDLYRQANGGVSVIAVRHDAPSVHVDYPEYVFFPSHDPAGGDSMTAYSSANTQGDGAKNTFELNATAITELTACIEGSGNGGVGTSSFEVAVVSNLDYTNTEPSDRTELGLGFRTQEYSGTSSDPLLSVIYSTAAAVTHNATFFGANF